MKRISALISLGLLLLACDPPEKDVPVSSVSLNKSSMELTVGETTRLSATVSPADATDKTVSWNSSNSSVATVSNSGEVKAVAVGSASITASAGGKSATCAVMVVNPTVNVSSVTLDKERLDLTVGGTAKLTATVSPADATDRTVTWESSDASVATVDSDGNVKALKGGTSTVTAKAGGKSASALVDVMDVTPSSVDVAAEGGDIQVTVITTRKYHVDSKPEWITEGSVSNQVHTFKVSANEDLTGRSGVIVICDEIGTCLSCNVKQAGAEKVFTVSPDKVDLGASGGTFEVTVTANYPTHLSSTPDWVTQKSVKDNVYTFEAAANESMTERSGVIVFCDDEGMCLPCSVKQAGADVYLTVSPDSSEFDPKGGNVSVSVKTNDGWTASSDASWCTVSPASGSGDGTLKVTVAEYGGQGRRNASVTVKTGKGLVKTVAVDQYGIVPFDLNPYTVDIAQEGGTFDVKITSSYGYHISSISDWISEVSVNNKVHTFRVAANPEFENRKGAVTFCDDEGTCLSVEVKQAKRIAGPDVVDWSKEFYHKSLLMVFSATWDSYTPEYGRSVKKAQSKKPGKIEVMSVYESGDILRFEYAEALMSMYNVNSYPMGIFDGRREVYNYWTTDDLTSLVLEALGQTESAFPTVSAIGWSSSFSGNKLTIDAHVFVKEAGDYKYTVLLLEDGVKCEQYDGSTLERNYIHDGIARMALTDIKGDYFKAYSSNTVKSKKFTVDIPDSYVKENLRILVYVQRAYGKMQKFSPTDFDGYFIDNCSSGKAGEVKVPLLVSGTSGDNEDATEGKPINW